MSVQNAFQVRHACVLYLPISAPFEHWSSSISLTSVIGHWEVLNCWFDYALLHGNKGWLIKQSCSQRELKTTALST